MPKPNPKAIPFEVDEILGPAALLRGDDRDWYEDTRAKFAAAIMPEDNVIWIFVDDLTYYTAEILRLRRVKAALVDLALEFALYETIIGPINEGGLKLKQKTEEFLQRYFISSAERGVIEHIFGLTLEALTARAYEVKQDELAALDKMLVSFEARRVAVLREIELRRIVVAKGCVRRRVRYSIPQRQSW